MFYNVTLLLSFYKLISQTTFSYGLATSGCYHVVEIVLITWVELPDVRRYYENHSFKMMCVCVCMCVHVCASLRK